MEKDFSEIFASLRERCANKLLLVKKSESGIVELRSNITRVREAALFVETFEIITHSRFKLYHQSKQSYSMLFRKVYVCQNSLSAGSENNCRAKISIAVHKLSSRNKANDEFLMLSPPLQAVIQIYPRHHHKVVKACTKRLSRIPNKICEIYYSYFRKGIKGVKAKRLYEAGLQKSNVTAVDDTRLNPHVSTIYSLYKRWKMLSKKAKANKVPTTNSGAVCYTSERTPWHDRSAPNSQEIFENKFPIKVEVQSDEEENYPCPKIVSCFSLAPKTASDVMPMPSTPTVTNSVLGINNQPVPLIANNVISASNLSLSVQRVVPINDSNMVLYNLSSNTYTVVQLCSSTSPIVTSSNLYSAYFPNRIQLPTRVGIHKL